jgi:hypothetical protein
MKFEEYLKKVNCSPFSKTEQSELFLTETGRICKHYFEIKDKSNELYFYNFFNKKDLLKTPEIYLSGSDFIEIEYLKNEGSPNLIKIIETMSSMYLKTWGINSSMNEIDLSKEKLLHRIDYLGGEIKKRKVNPEILKKSKTFVEKGYAEFDKRCVIHGDLKSSHVFQTKEGIKFIDFALSGISNPWYDLSFICMEEQEDKKRVFNEVLNASYFYFGDFLKLKKEEISTYLQSAIFYRELYFLGFALRHRPQKSLDRTIKELNEVLNMKR